MRADLDEAKARTGALSTKLHALLDTSRDCIFSLDRTLRFTYLNTRARKFFGFRIELIGRSILEHVPGVADCAFAGPLRRVLTHGGSALIEAFYPEFKHWYEASIAADDDGVTVFFRDTTRKHRAQEALQFSLRDRRRDVEAVLDGLPEMAWSAHPDGTHDYSNRQWHDFTGIAADAPDKAAAFMALVHPDDQPEILRSWNDARSAQASVELRFRLRHHSGAYRWVCGRAKPEDSHRGVTPTHWYGTCTDIHAGVLAEQALAHERELLQTVIDSVSDLIFVKDLSNRFVLANDALAQGCGVTIGSRTSDRPGAKAPDVYERTDAQVIANRQALEIETNITVNGEERLFHTVKVPWVVNGKVAGVIGVARDITERAQVQGRQRANVERLRQTLNTIPEMVWSMSADGSEHYYNEGWEEFTGVQLNAGRDSRLALVHLEDRAAARSAWEQALRDNVTYDFEYRMRHHSGEFRWVHSRARKELGGVGQGHWYGVVSDIHDRKSGELALAQSELLHRSILEASGDCINILALDGGLELMNAPGARALEIDDLEPLLGRDWATLWPTEARTTVTAAIIGAQAGHPARFSSYWPTTRGTPKWWDVVVTPMTNDLGEVTRILAIARDITSTRQAADQLQWTSEHDALTDLPNRRLFQAQLQAATIRAMESGGLVGLLLIDLDHFKHVNDTLGHAAGDHLLKTFGQRLKASVRETDVIARLGGDEFAVILEGVEAEDDVVRVGSMILSRLQAPIRFDGRIISTGASIGGALFPTNASSANELFKSADTALYSLKGSGRGGTRMFHNYMREEAQDVARQLNLARIAITERSVVPFYQQKVELKTGRVRGFEALLRWKHPGKGIQLPDTVAEAFKDYELASKIGELMQEKVFSDMSGWQQDGIEFGRVSINASPAEFLRDDYAEKLLARLGSHRLRGDLVEVEVTEHVFLDRGAQYVSRALGLLSEAGVRLSLDDFGTGYSSLSHLCDFPVDVVKIDRSFIEKMVHEQEIASIVTAIIDLAASLSLEVVAEGVETADQYAMLKHYNCALGQGFLFGPAVVADDVRQLLGSRVQ